ncbi:unnamed protein product [Calypogeia fissa]
MEKVFLVFLMLVGVGLQKDAVRHVCGQMLDPDSPYSGYQTEYTRPAADLDLTLDEPIVAPNPLGGPEQVFVTVGDSTGTTMTISWSSNKTMETLVFYSTDRSNLNLSATGGTPERYKYLDYTSGLLHHVSLRNLQYDTHYYYKIGISNEEYLSFYGDFTTPPAPGPDTPLKFAIVGDIGQTYSSNTTLSHLEQSGGQFLLNVGDFSYADGYQPRWDTWGRMMTPYLSKVPIIFTFGNHEIESDVVVGERDSFVSASNRLATPWASCLSPSPLFYSTNVGPVHIISINSYVSLAKYTPQYTWLEADLRRVKRSVTPWVIIIVHAPWYNTYNAHYLEGEVMRTAVEYFARKYRVDAIFAGHVHSYERFKRLYYYSEDKCAPLYITIGDGGNREGPASEFQINPQPDYSVYREPSFGHGTLEIFNKTTALFQWHRNQDNEAVTADYVYLNNLYGVNDCSKPAEFNQPVYNGIAQKTQIS